MKNALFINKMKIIGKKQHPILGEIDDIIIEESDFDFSMDWEELSYDKKADFLSFMKIPFLGKCNEHTVEALWFSYKAKYTIDEPIY